MDLKEGFSELIKNRRLFTFLVQFILFFGISFIIIWGGYYGFFNQLETEGIERFNFARDLALLGIFVGAVVFAKEKKTIETTIWGNLSFLGSLIIFLFWGIQGIIFRNFGEIIKNLSLSFGSFGATGGTVILFTGLIGLGWESIKAIVKLINKLH